MHVCVFVFVLVYLVLVFLYINYFVILCMSALHTIDTVFGKYNCCYPADVVVRYAKVTVSAMLTDLVLLLCLSSQSESLIATHRVHHVTYIMTAYIIVIAYV